jgi:metal-dependent amidase/aminoacylase/carboxypeptidase family protein
MGLRITLTGKTAHAAQPEAGTSPAPAVARLLTALPALGQGGDLVA